MGGEESPLGRFARNNKMLRYLYIALAIDYFQRHPLGEYRGDAGVEES